MDISRPEHYYQAALERIEQAEYLYREGKSYALAMYIAGVAVECMLRAYRLRISSEFKSRHNVLLLLNESDILNDAEEVLRAAGWLEERIASHVRALRTSVGVVDFLWHNNYRFASEKRALAYLKHLKLYRGVKGNPLRAKSLQLLDAAKVVIVKGSLQWHL